MGQNDMTRDFASVDVTIDGRGVATLTLNRPEVRNVLGKQLIGDLRDAVAYLKGESGVRCVVLTGAGEAFCAGGDLRWMQDNMGQPRDVQIDETTALADMLHDLDTFPALVIGRINGAAYGGGLGLISVCDIAIGVETAKFALTEVRLGLIAATISPYVVARIGVSNARRTMLNATMYNAKKAVEFGLLHACVPEVELDDAIEREIKLLLKCGPGAVARSKELIAFVSSHQHEENRRYTANALADVWETEEGQEGPECFFAKRTPSWARE
jgi:methylglutaconyl-CoA hydratase